MPTVDPKLVDEVIKLLAAPYSKPLMFVQPWDPKRSGPNLVTSMSTIDDLMVALGMKIRESNVGAFYDPAADVVTLPLKTAFLDRPEETATEAYYSTLMHEVAHWTGHKSRLNRLPVTTPSLYAGEELVAETTAIILLRHLGVTLKDMVRHIQYFQIWLARLAPRGPSLAYARLQAERAANFVLK